MKAFISFAGRDSKFADQLSEALRRTGVEPRMVNLKAICGDENPDCLKRELGGFDCVVPMFSKAYMDDEWLQTELLHCQMHEMEAKGRNFLYPVVIGPCTPPANLRKKLINFAGAPFEQAFAQLREAMSKLRQVFVTMKFGDDELESVFELVVKPVAEEFGYNALRIDKVQDSGLITEQMLQQIRSSVVVFADLTGERPNCYYEVGYAHGLGKELILAVKKNSDIHFNLQGHRFIEWAAPLELKEQLRGRFKAIQERLSNTPGPV